MRCFKGEELNLQKLTRYLFFVVVLFKESRVPGRKDISGSTNTVN